MIALAVLRAERTTRAKYNTIRAKSPTSFISCDKMKA